MWNLHWSHWVSCIHRVYKPPTSPSPQVLILDFPLLLCGLEQISSPPCKMEMILFTSLARLCWWQMNAHKASWLKLTSATMPRQCWYCRVHCLVCSRHLPFTDTSSSSMPYFSDSVACCILIQTTEVGQGRAYLFTTCICSAWNNEVLILQGATDATSV